MSQGLRDMLANRRFALLMIGGLGLCLVGLFVTGIVIIFHPGKSDEQLTQVGDTLAVGLEASASVPTKTLVPTQTPSPTTTPTPRPTATLVPVGTVTSQPLPTETLAATAEPVTEVEPTAAATAQPVAQATDDPAAGDNELAETGMGWGLVLVSGVGLAALALVARRMRLANY